MLNYHSIGAGKTIVFIHGISQSLKTWDLLQHNSALAGYRLIFADLPGHGSSPRNAAPEQEYTLKGMAAQVKIFLDEVAGNDYIVVAGSIATCFVAEVIAGLPRCKGLFFIGACVVGKAVELPDMIKPSPYFPVTFSPDPDDNDLRGFITTMGVNLPDGIIDSCMRLFRETDPAFREQIGASVAAGEWSDEIALLEQCPYPVAVVYGADDAVIFPEYLSRVGLRMWQDKIVLIPQSGHCSQLDQPKELAWLIGQYADSVFI